MMLHSASSSPHRGMALVIVLSLVVLVTVTVVAFFSVVTSTRLIEASRAHRTKAELLARTAGEYVTGEFLAEIVDPARSDCSRPHLYIPSANANALPSRMLSDAVSADAEAFFNLVRQSVAAADPKASADNSADPARNQRRVEANRWNLPHLLEGGGFQAASQLPHWIYITQTDGLTNIPSSRTIGRFAYNVYDVGGLINANVAGYPETLDARDVANLKAFGAGADLTALGINANDVGLLTAFRNPDGIGSVSAYRSNVIDAAQSGFLSLVTENATGSYTNNYFSSRQDLLRYAAMQNTAFTKALPYLTHFSRALTAPSWCPPTPSASNPNLPGIGFAAAGTVIHYRDDGTSETVSVQEGTPLLQRRFSLAKLAWLTATGPAAGIPSDAIRSVFGLEWNDTKDRWDYVGSDGSITPLLGISTLSDVAAYSREPNFFELLKAGILEGSLGAAASQKTMAGTANQILEASKDLQILRIGACIIDQADEDNYPTILSFDGDLEVAGVEDLPYFYQMAMGALRKTNITQTPNKLTHADMIWAPVFFNPHRASSPTIGPTEIVMDIARGSLTRVMASSGNELVQSLVKDLSVLPGITIASSNFENFRSSPKPAENASAINRLGTQVPYASGNVNVQVLKLFSYQSEYSGTWPESRPASDSAVFRVNVDDLIIRLRYRNAKGNLKTYATLAGHEAIPGSGWNGSPHVTQGMITGFGPGFGSASRLQYADLSLCYYATLWDPRSNRLGPSYGFVRQVAAAPALSGDGERVHGQTPFAYTDDAAQPVYPALWPQGGRGGADAGAYSNYADPDGKFRPADGWLGDNANLFRNLNDANRRPVILHRPFRSVAELGYVFRDTPWKTLSFFDETSGDGALLDLFSVVDEPVVTAGRVSLNTRQKPVFEALLKGTAQLDDGTSPISDPSALTSGYHDYAFASGLPTAQTPRSVASLADFISSSKFPSGLSIHKPQREAAVRALASTTQTRTWNLLIDIIAQSGKFPGASLSAENFIVEGEKRYWLSIAIDRYTGKIIDEQWEAVYE